MIHLREKIKMAVVWKTEQGARKYVTPNGLPPTKEDVELADRYEKELQQKIELITTALTREKFFETKNKMRKWYLLGKKLHFVDKMPLRLKCDPFLENTWRAFYDAALHLTPTGKIPVDKNQFIGTRNHFYVCYLLGKYDWKEIKTLDWSAWLDIYRSFSPDMWKDKRILQWLINQSTVNGKVNVRRLRKVLKVVRSLFGRRVKNSTVSSVLSDEEFFSMLRQVAQKMALPLQ